jgi:hypothetical protein
MAVLMLYLNSIYLLTHPRKPRKRLIYLLIFLFGRVIEFVMAASKIYTNKNITPKNAFLIKELLISTFLLNNVI